MCNFQFFLIMEVSKSLAIFKNMFKMTEVQCIVRASYIPASFFWKYCYESRPLSNMLKNCPKCFWNIPKFFTYYALHTSHYACIMLEYEKH